MACEHDWVLTDAKILGWYMSGDTPEFSGVYEAVCYECGETHEGEWDGKASDLPFEGDDE